MSGFFSKVKEKFRNVMLAPGATDPYQDDYYEEDYYEEDYEEEDEPIKVHYTPSSERKSQAARGTSTRTPARSTASNVYSFAGANNDNKSIESMVMHPKVIEDAVIIGDHVRSGRMCIVDLTNLETQDAQRIADYLGGVCRALDGSTTRVNNGIFTVSPQNHRVSAEYREEDAYDEGFLAKVSFK